MHVQVDDFLNQKIFVLPLIISYFNTSLIILLTSIIIYASSKELKLNDSSELS